MIDELTANPPENSIILSFDEKGRTPVKHYEGRKWVDNRDENGVNMLYKTPGKQNVKGLLDYFAAKDIHSGKIYHAYYDWKNAFIAIDFCERLLRKVPSKIIYLILDCWSVHRSKELKIFCDLNPRLRLVFLPTNASWMNLIERFFSQVERFVLRNSNFQNVGELMSALSSFVTFGALI